MSSTSGRRVLYAGLALVMLARTPTIEPSQLAGVSLPSQLESYLTTVVRPTPNERRRLMNGAPITKLLDDDPVLEVAVFGALWIKAPIRHYVEAVQDIENFERGGGFKVTRRISTPPRLVDFADLHLPADDVADLRTCRVGGCAVKLDQQSIERFRAEVDWRGADTQAAADLLMRRLACEYVTVISKRAMTGSPSIGTTRGPPSWPRSSGPWSIRCPR